MIGKFNPTGVQQKGPALGDFGVSFDNYKFFLFQGELIFWGELTKKKKKNILIMELESLLS